MHDFNDISDFEDFTNSDDFLPNETPDNIANYRNMQIEFCCKAAAQAYPYSEIKDHFTDVEITKEEYEELLEVYNYVKEEDKEKVFFTFKTKKDFVFDDYFADFLSANMNDMSSVADFLADETPEDIAYYKDMQIGLCCAAIASSFSFSQIEKYLVGLEISKEEYEELLENYTSAKEEDKEEILNAFKIKKGFVFDD